MELPIFFFEACSNSLQLLYPIPFWAGGGGWLKHQSALTEADGNLAYSFLVISVFA